ncbi:MAG: HyaD/HybD family hydrogenase maturation endopeptidase [Desulfovibrionaceae bacterium]|nr:HyaD/HybD family hydrogenase maturation endopeptidase [Desulfovibrionaceae bacterium]
MTEKNILVLGVGNILMRDEGFGVRAVEVLQQRYRWPHNVRLLEGGTLGMLLTPEMQSCDMLIVLDAVLIDQPAGTIAVLSDENLRKSLGFRDSTHQTDLVDILIYCDLLGKRPEALVYGMQPFDWQSFIPELTEQAAALLPQFCAKVVHDLQERGLAIQEIAQATPAAPCSPTL